MSGFERRKTRPRLLDIASSAAEFSARQSNLRQAVQVELKAMANQVELLESSLSKVRVLFAQLHPSSEEGQEQPAVVKFSNTMRQCGKELVSFVLSLWMTDSQASGKGTFPDDLGHLKTFSRPVDQDLVQRKVRPSHNLAESPLRKKTPEKHECNPETQSQSSDNRSMAIGDISLLLAKVKEMSVAKKISQDERSVIKKIIVGNEILKHEIVGLSGDEVKSLLLERLHRRTRDKVPTQNFIT